MLSLRALIQEHRLGKGRRKGSRGCYEGAPQPAGTLCSADVEVTLQELYWAVQGLVDSLPSALKSSSLLKHWLPSCHLFSSMPVSYRAVQNQR